MVVLVGGECRAMMMIVSNDCEGKAVDDAWNSKSGSGAGGGGGVEGWGEH